jgi:hypothetical protein
MSMPWNLAVRVPKDLAIMDARKMLWILAI